MVYELNWDISTHGVTLYSWMTNNKGDRWEVSFHGDHRKLLKIMNELNQKVFMGKFVYNIHEKTVQY